MINAASACVAHLHPGDPQACGNAALSASAEKGSVNSQLRPFSMSALCAECAPNTPGVTAGGGAWGAG